MNIGIVGCGGIARAHVAAYGKVEGVRIAWVYDVSAEAAAKLASETGAQVAPSLRAMVSKVDAVSICTPPASRFLNLRPFVVAGVPVLCEKPLAVNEKNAQRCAELAAQHNALVMVAFCHRFHPPVIELRKLLASGALGRPLLFRNIFGGYFKLDGNHRCDPKLSGGGPLIDHLAHSVDLFRHLVGEPASVTAVATNVLQQVPIEDLGVMLLQTADGTTVGELTGTYSLPCSGNWVEVHGEKGSARVSYWNPGVPDLTLRLAGEKEWNPIDCSAHPDRFDGEVRHFVECVRTRTQPSVTLADGVAANRVIDAAYKSARSGKRVAIG